MKWTVEYIKQAQKDLRKLDPYKERNPYSLTAIIRIALFFILFLFIKTINKTSTLPTIQYNNYL